jgi:hypothetical protein
VQARLPGQARVSGLFHARRHAPKAVKRGLSEEGGEQAAKVCRGLLSCKPGCLYLPLLIAFPPLPLQPFQASAPGRRPGRCKLPSFLPHLQGRVAGPVLRPQL